MSRARLDQMTLDNHVEIIDMIADSVFAALPGNITCPHSGLPIACSKAMFHRGGICRSLCNAGFRLVVPSQSCPKGCVYGRMCLPKKVAQIEAGLTFFELLKSRFFCSKKKSQKKSEKK